MCNVLLCVVLFVLVITVATCVLFVVCGLEGEICMRGRVLSVGAGFFASVVRRLHAPFALVITPVSRVLARGGLDPTVRRSLTLIGEGAERALGVVGRILSLRGVRGRSQLDIREVRVKPFVARVVSGFRSVTVRERDRVLLRARSSPVFL